MAHDSELLRRYAEEGSEAAFTELVQRNLRLVFGSALRRAGGDRELALDVSQKVFGALALHARPLSRHPTLTAWLYATARNESIKAILSESRRRKRELDAATMNRAGSNGGEPVAWDDVRPILDNVMDELDSKEREAVLLRFFDERSFAEVAGALRVSEDAARKRVERALGRLRSLFARRGVVCSAAAVGELLASQPAIAGHASLVSAISTSALAGAAAPSGLAAAVTLMSPAKVSLAAAGLIVALGALNIAAHRTWTGLSAESGVIAVRQDADIRAARTENLFLRAALNAARAPKPEVTDDASRMVEMADLIQSGVLGTQTWPLPQPTTGQDNLLVAAGTVAEILGLSEIQTAAFQEALWVGRANFRAALASGASVTREGNEAAIRIDDAGIDAARKAYDAMLVDIESAISPEKMSLLKLCGFLPAVHVAFGSLGIRATTATITKGPLLINGRAVAGYRYDGRFTGGHGQLLYQPGTSNTFGSNARSGLDRLFGDLAGRLPPDF